MVEKRATAAWVIPLVGDRFDLEDLPLWLAGQGVHVAERAGAFELVIPVAIVGDNYESVRAFAEEQLDLINGVGRLLGQAFRPLSLADKLFGIDARHIVGPFHRRKDLRRRPDHWLPMPRPFARCCAS